METYKVKKANSKEKPLVMVVKNSKKGTTLIVAVMGFTRESNFVRNDFGQRFRRAAEKTGVKTKHDGFDSALIEIKNEDQRPFMDELQRGDDE
jgi:cell division control protein 45